MRRRSSASCSSGTSIRNGRTAVASAVTDMTALLGLLTAGSLALLSARRACEHPGPLPGLRLVGDARHTTRAGGPSNEWHQIDTRPLRTRRASRRSLARTFGRPLVLPDEGYSSGAV